ncbi:hypothetical protein FGF1_16940 [Flavobacteriaceae bacterium GF1]
MRNLWLLVLFLPSLKAWSQQNPDYATYHQEVLTAEARIADRDFKGALQQLEQIMMDYDFVFLKEYKIASQLALKTGDTLKTFQLVKEGIKSGWSLKEIRRNAFFKPLKRSHSWKKLMKSYPILATEHQGTVNGKLHEEVHDMFKRDQKLALGYLFRIGQKAKEKYANKKVVPHTKKQMEQLRTILEIHGYPGEKLVGDGTWMSVILSHHNSVSEDFSKRDTLYEALRPQLLVAITKGELNPYEFALIEDWRIAVKYDRQKAGYGYIEYLNKDQLSQSNALRKQLNIRSIALRNTLVDIQKETRMDFYLAGSGWVNGKIGL